MCHHSESIQSREGALETLLCYILLSSAEIPVVNSQGKIKEKTTHIILGKGFLQVCFALLVCLHRNYFKGSPKIKVSKNQCSAEEVVCCGHLQTKY